MDKNAHNRLLVGALDCLVKVVIIVNWQQIRIPAVCNDEIVFLRDQLVYCPDLYFLFKKNILKIFLNLLLKILIIQLRRRNREAPEFGIKL